MRREWIPNLLTLGNLGCGFGSLLLSAQGQFELAAVAVLAGGALDGLDGAVARLMRVASPTGQELDSLADVVSFGVAPAFLMYTLDLHYLGATGTAIATAFVLCAGLRLARFNVAAPSSYFVGLPSTAAGMLVASFVLYEAKLRSPFYPVLALMLAVLMISRLRYRNLKHISFTELRLSKLFLILAIASALVLVNPKKLFFVPLTAYLLYGFKDGLLAVYEKQARKRTAGKAEMPDEAKERE